MAASNSDSAAPAGTAMRGAPITVLAQYLKDLSFESPNAPEILTASGEAGPKGVVQVDVRARQLGQASYEVSLNINVEARQQEQVAYVVEIEYAGQFQIANVPPEATEPLVMIECPRLLFPYARAILSMATREGGFAPLFINPIDFAALYREHRQRAVQEAELAAASPA